MAYELVRDGDYPGTDLPVYKVYPAGDPKARAIGEVWETGVRGVSGRFIPTGTRFQLSGSWEEAPVLPAGAYADAARAMIALYESVPATHSATA